MTPTAQRTLPPCALRPCRVRSLSKVHKLIIESVLESKGEAAGHIEITDRGDLLIDTIGARRLQRVAWENVQLLRDELPEANSKRLRIIKRLIKELSTLITRIDEAQLAQFEAAR